MYDPKSLKAEEFIDDDEIQATIRYARENRSNRELIDSIIETAKQCKGVNHRDALVLLECDLPDENEKIFQLAREIKEKFYDSTCNCNVITRERSDKIVNMVKDLEHYDIKDLASLIY